MYEGVWYILVGITRSIPIGHPYLRIIFFKNRKEEKQRFFIFILLTHIENYEKVSTTAILSRLFIYRAQCFKNNFKRDIK